MLHEKEVNTSSWAYKAPTTPVPVFISRNKKLALSTQSCVSEPVQVPEVVLAMKNVGKEQATFSSS